ncbi:DUF3717 domain-containing protein [Burkholderia sp. MBR-1]|uniref:DUF3717 domain-containing protein n=1 Tax=Burkholderia sp. MBR-1 TaxID=2732364 RepID=UPI0015EFBEC2|nr:DUF3717 domain-containing protein [Burkholderia sp. MBR-1]QMI49692.1 DUF3717 domain-containing protein [Burkholderia sp. MBR-1]
MQTVSLLDLENAINYWREREPSTGDECALSPSVNALAEVYAALITERGERVPLSHLHPAACRAIQLWRAAFAANVAN